MELPVRPPVAPMLAGFLPGGGALGRLGGSAARWSPDMALDFLPGDVLARLGRRGDLFAPVLERRQVLP